MADRDSGRSRSSLTSGRPSLGRPQHASTPRTIDLDQPLEMPSSDFEDSFLAQTIGHDSTEIDLDDDELDYRPDPVLKRYLEPLLQTSAHEAYDGQEHALKQERAKLLQQAQNISHDPDGRIAKRLNDIRALLRRLDELKKRQEVEKRKVAEKVANLYSSLEPLIAEQQKIMAGQEVALLNKTDQGSARRDPAGSAVPATFFKVGIDDSDSALELDAADKDQLDRLINSFVLPAAWYKELHADARQKLVACRLAGDKTNAEGKAMTSRVRTASYVEAVTYDAAIRATDVTQRYEEDFAKRKLNLMRTIFQVQPFDD